jgi:hypothetical protein
MRALRLVVGDVTSERCCAQQTHSDSQRAGDDLWHPYSFSAMEIEHQGDLIVLDVGKNECALAKCFSRR